MSQAASKNVLWGLGTSIFFAQSVAASGRAASLCFGGTAGDGSPGCLGAENICQQDPSRQVLRGIHLPSRVETVSWLAEVS